jgi:hypothetical protein
MALATASQKCNPRLKPSVWVHLYGTAEAAPFHRHYSILGPHVGMLF